MIENNQINQILVDNLSTFPNVNVNVEMGYVSALVQIDNIDIDSVELHIRMIRLFLEKHRFSMLSDFTKKDNSHSFILGWV